jgi:hypothetical protein
MLEYLLLAANVGRQIYGNRQASRARRSARNEANEEIAMSSADLDEQARYINMGADIDQQLIGIRMEQNSLVHAEQSLLSAENLRSVLSSQRAIISARGQRGHQAQTSAITQGSVRAHGREERARKLSKDYNELSFLGQRELTEINRGFNISKINHEKRRLEHEAKLIGSKYKTSKRRANENTLGTLLNIANTGVNLLGSNGSLSGRTNARAASRAGENLF